MRPGASTLPPPRCRTVSSMSWPPKNGPSSSRSTRRIRAPVGLATTGDCANSRTSSSPLPPRRFRRWCLPPASCRPTRSKSNSRAGRRSICSSRPTCTLAWPNTTRLRPATIRPNSSNCASRRHNRSPRWCRNTRRANTWPKGCSTRVRLPMRRARSNKPPRRIRRSSSASRATIWRPMRPMPWA